MNPVSYQTFFSFRIPISLDDNSILLVSQVRNLKVNFDHSLFSFWWQTRKNTSVRWHAWLTGKQIPKKASKRHGNGSLQAWSRHRSWLTYTWPRSSLLTYLLKILGAFILGIRHHFPSPGPPQHKSVGGPAIPDRSSPSRVYTAIDRNENWEPSSS